MQKKILVSEERFKAIFVESPTGIEIYGADGDLVDVNQSSLHILGLHSADDLKGYTLFSNPNIPNVVKDGLLNNKTIRLDFKIDFDKTWYKTSRSGVVYVDAMFSPLRNKRALPAWGYLVQYCDITERKLMETELIKSREELRNLNSYIQTARETERSVIARKIHDELAQTLTGLIIDLSCVYEGLGKSQRLLRGKIKSMLKLVDETMKTAQRISAELRPKLLDDLGIEDAIRWHAREFEKRTGISCEVTFDYPSCVLSRDLSTAIFRIFQEATSNVYRHANANRVEVSLKQEGNTLKLQVRDNGRGITKDQIKSSKSFGLITIRERLLFWGGTVSICGIPGKGTTLAIKVPLYSEEETKC